jgi:DNA-binding PadR family transcriptional regulator
VRKYYAITAEGRVALAEARVKIAELTREAIEGHGPAHLPDPKNADPGEGVG